MFDNYLPHTTAARYTYWNGPRTSVPDDKSENNFNQNLPNKSEIILKKSKFNYFSKLEMIEYEIIYHLIPIIIKIIN